MVPPLLRSKEDRQQRPFMQSPSSSPFALRSRPNPTTRAYSQDSHRIAADYDEESDIEEEEIAGYNEVEEDEDEDDEESAGELTPLLPIFEASHLDALPVYNLTHAIRLLVAPRCETTLTWDQLRSPQISQFMIKPIQKNILTSHFSRATLYALMANFLQFGKEAVGSPGNSGTNKTRAMVCELLAIRLLKEYSVRELIDALSYEFFPLQGLTAISATSTPIPMRNWEPSPLSKQARVARISTLEIAIRSEAKRFLAHPLVVQQLEAIWAGTIVFHSAADNAHRPQSKMVPNQTRGYGAIGSRTVLLASQDAIGSSKQGDHKPPPPVLTRRTVILYNPREASLFKLSRLRVPRYRSFFSTCSLAVLLGLFMAVLAARSTDITPLEVLFWFWSAGFMLDEVVGFTDQGFSLYLLSFWNSLDLGILLVLVIFYCLRIFGLLMAGDSKVQIAQMAHDVLAVNAILLFPRLFSVLDHYRYFSQLLIAFRMMARDLIAILVLILISCSGFLVAFTLSFGNDQLQARDVAYILFQLIMGFTPAAWDRWEGYNFLGQAALVLFLFITHFLVVTILITVLTNSFMAIAQNANDEHQYVFAVNTISMVKSDALFSYIAPTNIIAWLLTPLRTCLPFRQYIKLNRTIIKITHFPVLFGICAYERLFLKRSVYEPADLVEQRGREGAQLHAFNMTGTNNLFGPKTPRARDRSAATHQERALDAVFRHPLRHQDSAITRGTGRTVSRRPRTEHIDTWFSKMGPENPASPPAEQDRKIVDRLERPTLGQRRSTPRPRRRERRNFTATTTMSVVSDPEHFMNKTLERPTGIREENEWLDACMTDSVQLAGEDGDDELVTQDENEEPSLHSKALNAVSTEAHDYFQSKAQPSSQLRQQVAGLSQTSESRSISFEPGLSSSSARPNTSRTRHPHQRNLSTNTILYNPVTVTEESSSAGHTIVELDENERPKSRHLTPPNEKEEPSFSVMRKTPKHIRPIMPDGTNFQSAPNLAGLLTLDDQRRNRGDRKAPYQLDLISDLGDNKAVGDQFVGGLPASLATHMGLMAGVRAVSDEGEDQRRMGKLMLARMNTLEEGFREVLREVKDWGKGSGAATPTAPIPMTPRRRGDGAARERDGKTAKSLGKKRKEGEWVEDGSSASDAQRKEPEGVSGSSV